MANELKFDGQYGGLGIASQRADSNDTVFTTSPTTLTATFPLVGGQQPPVSRGKIYIEAKALVATVTIGAVSVQVSDGTNLEYVGNAAAPAAATAGQGFSYVLEFYTSLAKVTNVVSVQAILALGVAGSTTGRLRALGGP
jgi:hypothetical protein